MRRARISGLLAMALVAPFPVAAQERARPTRVGNQNLLAVGVGHAAYDHPNFDADLFLNIAYQHRILRREMRVVPIWLRGAVDFVSQETSIASGYTVWGEGELGVGLEPVDERTSDFTVRGEFLVDVLHAARAATYAGVGFALHYITFRSDGLVSAIPEFHTSENFVAPSLVGGVRLFAVRSAFTAYGEVRYGRLYGKTDDLQGRLWLTDQTFAFKEVNAVSIEGGLGLHW